MRRSRRRSGCNHSRANMASRPGRMGPVVLLPAARGARIDREALTDLYAGILAGRSASWRHLLCLCVLAELCLHAELPDEGLARLASIYEKDRQTMFAPECTGSRASCSCNARPQLSRGACAAVCDGDGPGAGGGRAASESDGSRAAREPVYSPRGLPQRLDRSDGPSRRWGRRSSASGSSAGFRQRRPSLGTATAFSASLQSLV